MVDVGLLRVVVQSTKGEVNMRILWVGDAVTKSGFSVVTHGICDELQRRCDLTVFGIGYDGKARNVSNYYVFPAAAGLDIYSYSGVVSLIGREEFDVVVLFNDLSVVLEYAQHIRAVSKIPLIAFFPINTTPLNTKEVLELTSLDFFGVMVYTEFAKKQVEALNPNIPVEVVYHGVNTEVYNRDIGCKLASGLGDCFVVGYVGSNSYRKRLDLLLEGFSKFASGRDDVRCLLHVDYLNTVYPLSDMASYFGVSSKIILSAGVVPDARLRLYYSTMDVNVNTSLGEGFGLPLLEGAACRVPILCPDDGNLVDIWPIGADFIKIGRHEYIPGTNQVGAVIDTDDMAEKLTVLYESNEYLTIQGNAAYTRGSSLLFNWGIISNKVFNTIEKASKSRAIIAS